MNTAWCIMLWNQNRDDINLARIEIDKPGKLTGSTTCGHYSGYFLIYSSRNNFGLNFCLSPSLTSSKINQLFLCNNLFIYITIFSYNPDILLGAGDTKKKIQPQSFWRDWFSFRGQLTWSQSQYSVLCTKQGRTGAINIIYSLFEQSYLSSYIQKQWLWVHGGKHFNFSNLFFSIEFNWSKLNFSSSVPVLWLWTSVLSLGFLIYEIKIIMSILKSFRKNNFEKIYKAFRVYLKESKLGDIYYTSHYLWYHSIQI